MRIAVVSNTAWYLFNFRLNLMRALQAAGHDVVAVAPIDSYVEKITSAGVEFMPVPISGGGTNPFAELRSVAGFFGVFCRQRIDLVLSYTPKGNLYSALACMVSGRAYVPNVSGLGRAFIRRSLVTQIVWWLYKLTFARARHVFFQNNDDLSFFVSEGLVAADKAERLPGSGVDLERFALSMPERARGEAQGIDAPVFLMVARVMWDKGAGEYVEAAGLVRQQYPRARFQVLGAVDVDNPAAVPRTIFERWVADGLIEYLGTTDDVRPFLRGADCVVLPSYREGVPRTLLEAAAIGRPVITTDTTGCRDAVIDGETGYLCRVRDAADLHAKMIDFIGLASEERVAMGCAGRAFVTQAFDEKTVIDRYVALVGHVAC